MTEQHPQPPTPKPIPDRVPPRPPVYDVIKRGQEPADLQKRGPR